MTGQPRTTEQREALKLMQWARYVPILNELLFHVANERHCTPQQGHMFKCLGVKAGVSDYILPLPRGRYHGMFLELKRDRTGRLTPEQKIWLEKMRITGYHAVVAYGAEEAIQYFKEYLEIKNDTIGVFVDRICERCFSG